MNLEVQLAQLSELRRELQNLYQDAQTDLAQHKLKLSAQVHENATLKNQNLALKNWNQTLANELIFLARKMHLSAASCPDNSQSKTQQPSDDPIKVLQHLEQLRSGAAEQDRTIAESLIARLDASSTAAAVQSQVHHDSGRHRDSEPHRNLGVRDPDALSPSGLETQVQLDSSTEETLSTYVDKQQLLLELASMSVRHVELKSRLDVAEKNARASTERCQLLERSAQEMLGDLTDASQKISKLELRIADAAEKQTVVESQVRGATRRADSAQRVVARSTERHTELSATVHTLSRENRTLRDENMQLRIFARELGASEPEIATALLSVRKARARHDRDSTSQTLKMGTLIDSADELSVVKSKQPPSVKCDEIYHQPCDFPHDVHASPSVFSRSIREREGIL